MFKSFWKPIWGIVGLYLVLALATVPLVAGWVPPNPWYGFRFPGALESPTLWYRLNAIGGRNLLIALAVCVVVNLLVAWKGSAGMMRNLGWINAGLILLSFWSVTLDLLDQLP
jgi:hypothetical protein